MYILSLTTPYDAKRIITYASDHTTTIYHNRRLQFIIGNIYKDKEKSDKYGQISCHIYCFYDNVEMGIDLGGMVCFKDMTPEEIEQRVIKMSFDTTDNFIAMLEDSVTNHGFISNSYIELAKYIKPERVEMYKQARLDYRTRKDKEEAERRVKCDAKDKAFVECKNAEAEQNVINVIQSIITGGKIDNIRINVYKDVYNSSEYSVFNYLAYQYSIEIPIKVRGWINKKLANIIVKDGKITSYRYNRTKGTHGSQTAWDYIQKILDAVVKTKQVA